MDLEINLEITSEKFFETLEINFNHNYVADFYWSKTMTDYIYDVKLGWFGYNLHNKLIRYGKDAPIYMLNDITGKFKAELNIKFSKLNTNDKNFLGNCKTYKRTMNKIGDTRFCESVIGRLKSLYNKENFYKLIDNNNLLIPFEDCVYDLKTSLFRDIKKTDYISITTGYYIKYEISKLGYTISDEKYINKYGGIINDKLDIKYIDDFLSSIFDDDLKNYMVDILSHNLIHNNFEKLWIWCGSGGNGKGVLASLLSSSLGDLYYKADSQFLTTKYKGQTANSTLYNCQNKRFVMVSEPEISEGQKELKFNVEFLKGITGRDELTCRALKENNITFKPTFNLICQTNEKPTISGIDNAIKRRLVIIPFKYTFVETPIYQFHRKIDTTLKDKFNSEKYIVSFIFYLINNLEKLYNENGRDIERLIKSNIKMPEDIKDEIENYLDENDIIGKFTNEEIIRTNNKDDYILKTDLYKEFINYLDNNKNDKISKDKFYNYLKSNNIIEVRKEKKGKTMRIYEGIKLKSEEEEENDGFI
jgi:P4 family phage/plasmid primase-like protien